MPPVLSCVNLKGGVGKTALAVGFAQYCGRAGKRTLLIDLDPQTNATFSCIDIDVWKKHADEHGSVADLLGAKGHASAEGNSREAQSTIFSDVFRNVDLIPSHLDLFTIDLDLAGTTARETKLRRAVAPVLDNYDVVVCDCPPNLTIPTQNALALSSHYVVPISPDYLSGLGIGLLITRVRQLADDLELTLVHTGIVISRVGRPAMHRDQTVESIRQKFGDLVVSTQITERVKVSEAAAAKKPIYEMGDAEAASEFTNVSCELLRRIGVDQ